MDFFRRQERARLRSRWLIAAFVVAVILVSGAVGLVLAWLAGAVDGRWALPDGAWLADQADLVGAMALATAAFILGASVLRLWRLRSGGGEVAANLGGQPVLPEDRDAARRRFQNVVEEMAIAAGIPAPQAYVLEHEAGINAFAAGHDPSDAAVAVTRGALERLSRAELQGVVGHEFSHILNGDMRLNLRLMGYLFGILAVSTIGRGMLRSGARGRVSSGRGRGAPVLVLAGIALYALGYAGVLTGRLIQAAVSRQRELLADAAAVQFTRDPGGLAGALSKIAGLETGSGMRAVRAEEVSHMLFASGRRTLAGLFATHPPIEERLAALGVPGGVPASRGPAVAARDTAAAGGRPVGSARAAVPATAVTGAVGLAETGARTFAATLADRVPASIWDAAHRSDLAVPCLFGLILDPAPLIRERQLRLLRGRLGGPVADQADDLALGLGAMPRAERLAVADVAIAALRLQPDVRRAYLTDTLDGLVSVDGEVDVFEALLAGRMAACLGRLDRPHRPEAADAHARAAAAITVLATLALEAHPERTAADAAFRAGLNRLTGSWPIADSTPLPTRSPPPAAMRPALQTLAGMPPAEARVLVDAMAATAADDGEICEREFALLRVVCGALGLPLPPVIEPSRNTPARSG